LIDPKALVFLVEVMTPLMRQYWDIKSAHHDKVVLFRMGDFFEMFFEDATTAAPILGIALTSRNKKSAEETPMCGVPYHSIAGPINKLLKSGLKVAICEQVEDPKLAKGLVKRAVTRILTPGMVYDPDTLEQTVSNYLACLDENVLACVETSTGEGFYFADLSESEVRRLISVLPIAEMVVAQKTADLGFSGLVSEHANCREGVEGPKALCRLLSYIQSLGGEEALQTLQPFEKRSLKKRLDLSSTVIRHLEIFSTYRGDGAGSLFQAMDRTKTSAGARLLRQWLLFPLTDENEIYQRQAQVEKWMQDPGRLKKLREILGQMGDIERRLGKISQPQCNGRDLLALSQSVEAGLSALEISQAQSQQHQFLKALKTEIETTLVEEPPLQTKQGHLIRKGYSAMLDEWITLSTDSQSLLQEMEAREKEKTGITSLKIRYNNVFGYYIEVTHTHKEKVPSHYLRKQTLSNAERYYTDELAELEKKVLAAQGKRAELECEIFEELRKKCLAAASDLLKLATLCSELDVSSSLAWLAVERKYVKPVFNSKRLLLLKASRHPVVEQTVKQQFVPNDIELSSQGCLLLTGPNMAGKSTLMRQVALTVILAQIGSYVPADVAELPLFDHLFTRIGASDQLSEGLSTFMVEMTESAEMLAKSSEKSLLILDEIGRGTSTFDGMSLAQAILEFLLEKKKAMTFFATHYHELTSLEAKYPQLRNAHMTVLEKNGEIRFLHTLKLGPAQKSYGIQVARLAGLPSEITARAHTLLKNLEKKEPVSSQLSLLEFQEEFQAELEVEQESLSVASASALAPAEIPAAPAVAPATQTPEFISVILKDLKQFPVLNKTPLEAMNTIAKWQEALKVSQETDIHS
jgi:DNA mismatch repair protein MutS